MFSQAGRLAPHLDLVAIASVLWAAVKLSYSVPSDAVRLRAGRCDRWGGRPPALTPPCAPSSGSIAGEAGGRRKRSGLGWAGLGWACRLPLYMLERLLLLLLASRCLLPITRTQLQLLALVGRAGDLLETNKGHTVPAVLWALGRLGCRVNDGACLCSLAPAASRPAPRAAPGSRQAAQLRSRAAWPPLVALLRGNSCGCGRARRSA